MLCKETLDTIWMVAGQIASSRDGGGLHTKMPRPKYPIGTSVIATTRKVHINALTTSTNPAWRTIPD
jgi:hypothetical protein